MTETVASLAALVGGRVVGDRDRAITGVGDLRHASAQQIGFVRDAAYRGAAQQTRAGALIVAEELDTAASQIVVADVSIAYAKVALHFHPVPRARVHRIHPSAVVHPEAVLAEPVEIGPRAVVGRASLGAGTVVMAGAVVGDGCRLGDGCVLYPNVVLYHGLQLGARVVVHGGTVLGSDGFGYANEDGRWLKLPQLGGVVVGDDVEIGANCTIDRGTIGDTRIGARSKIDNLCHIAHNTVLGTDCALAAACFLAGSTVIGDRVTLAGHVVCAGHLQVPSDTRVGGNSVVLRDIDETGDYMGWPLLDKRQFGRHLAALRELLAMQADLVTIKKQLGLEREGE